MADETDSASASTSVVVPVDSKKVLVVGGGCAGLGCAWHLNRSGVDVTLYEKHSKVGGHANTIHVDGVDIDTGFMVYNELNYPNLCAFFKELSVEGTETSMGFSVSMDNGQFEWCSDSLSGLIATPSNIINPKFYLMMKDIFRFNKEAKHLLSLPDDHHDDHHHHHRSVTTGEFLLKHGFSIAFRDCYLIPMTAAIWSATTGDMLGFPAITLFTFLDNHMLLQVSEHIFWMTPKQRSQEYVSKVAAELGDKIQVNKQITSIKRKLKTESSYEVLVTDSDGLTVVFDEIVFACHPDQALSLLTSGDDASSEEIDLLSCFRYSSNDTYVHSDKRLMPKSRSAWTSWNYIYNNSTTTTQSSSEKDGSHSKPVYVTYWLNKLQSLKHGRNIFVSLNPDIIPDPKLTYSKLDYAHPQYSLKAVAAQKSVRLMQGKRGTYYCGAWMGYGFHEDGFRSGLEVAVAISSKQPPWGQVIYIPTKITADDAAAAKGIIAEKKTMKGGKGNKDEKAAVGGRFSWLGELVWSWIKLQIVWLFEKVCQDQVLKFLVAGMRKGKLTIVLPNREIISVVGASNMNVNVQKCTVVTTKTLRPLQQCDEVKVDVSSAWFFIRLALEADLGLARSYIAGEWDVAMSPTVDTDSLHGSGDALTRFLLLLIDNMPTGRTAVSGGLDVRDMITASIGTAINALWFKLTMDNSIANSRTNIHQHYDLSNDLFETFLDDDHMMYSSAIFDTAFEESKSSAVDGVKASGSVLVHRGSIEEAQLRKIDTLLSKLEPITPDMTLLDIGFGWGGICIRAAQKYGCHVVGITLSVEQKALAEKKVKAKGLEHLISFELIDYREFANKKRSREELFDRIVSCEMIEAVGHNYLGSFFAAVESLLAVDGMFVMQAITIPDARYPVYVKSADYINSIIFPGGCCPSLSALLSAMASNSKLHLESANNTNSHYAETLRRWRYKFNSSLTKVRALGFDDTFIRLWNLYFCYCEAGFEAKVINLQILAFTRPGNLSLYAS